MNPLSVALPKYTSKLDPLCYSRRIQMEREQSAQGELAGHDYSEEDVAILQSSKTFEMFEISSRLIISTMRPWAFFTKTWFLTQSLFKMPVSKNHLGADLLRSSLCC